MFTITFGITEILITVALVIIVFVSSILSEREKKRTLDRLLKEEREKYSQLFFDAGYRTREAEQGGKGFITGKDALFAEIEDYLRKGV